MVTGDGARRRFLLYLLPIILLGAGWRFANAGGDSLWLDEVTTLRNAQKGLEAMYGEYHHPPLLHLLTYLFINNAGTSELVLRFPALMAGVLAVPLIAVLGRVAGYSRAGLWCALVLAVLPFHLRYSQEARYYGLLMTTSTITFILLYKALSRRKLAWWLAWSLATVLNLYTHYGAVLILGWQLPLTGLWTIRHLRSRQRATILHPVLAGILIAILYLPWLPRLLIGLDINTGEDAAFDTGRAEPLGAWLHNIYLDFGFGAGILPLLVLILFLVGLLAWLRQRQWLLVSFICAGLIIPLVMIVGLDVARWAFPKYVIYLLPLYLLPVGVGLDTTIDFLARALSGPLPVGRRGVASLVAGALVVVTSPLLRTEHHYVQQNWELAATFVGQQAREGDLIVSVSLHDLPLGQNEGSVVLPYYLDRFLDDYGFLGTNLLRPVDVQPLTVADRRLWLIVSAVNQQNPVQFPEGFAEVTPLADSLYIVRPLQPTGPDLQKLIATYQQLIPIANAPSPQCFLRHDLATLYAVSQQYEMARQEAEQASSQCPEGKLVDIYRYLLLNDIYYNLLTQYRAAGKLADAQEIEEKARPVALRVLHLEAWDRGAVEILTLENLLHRFEAGEAQVTQGTSPEPVRVGRYTMPQNGDWGDVLFIHAGASVSFRVTVPHEPTALAFRVAMDPATWEWGGDGSTFVLTAEATGEEPRELYRQHVSNDPANRDWHDTLVPLASYAGQQVTLTFTTEPGPSGDYTGDWAGWETPRIIRWQASED